MRGDTVFGSSSNPDESESGDEVMLFVNNGNLQGRTSSKVDLAARNIMVLVKDFRT
jgi:hypothetical protein